MADEHGRDNVGEIELAFDANAKFIGLRLHMLASIGAYIASDRQLLTPFGQIGTVVGVYDIPAAYVTIDAVLSNTSPTAPYRGAGRPEASYLIERVDGSRGARAEHRSDRAAPPQCHPRREDAVQDARSGPFYDCGEFAKNMEMALEASDHAGFAARREASRAQRHAARLSASPMPSSRRPARRRNMPKSASSRAAARCC